MDTKSSCRVSPLHSMVMGRFKGHGVCSQDNLCQLPLQVTHVRLQFDDLLLQLLDLRLCSSVRCSRRLRGKRPGDKIGLCCVAPRVGIRDSQSTLCCVAPRVGVRDAQYTLCCVAPQVEVRDSQPPTPFGVVIAARNNSWFCRCGCVVVVVVVAGGCIRMLLVLPVYVSWSLGRTALCPGLGCCLQEWAPECCIDSGGSLRPHGGP